MRYQHVRADRDSDHRGGGSGDAGPDSDTERHERKGGKINGLSKSKAVVKNKAQR